MQIIDARNDPAWWYTRRQMRRIAEQHRETMAAALVVTPQEFSEGSQRIADAVAAGRVVLVRDAASRD